VSESAAEDHRAGELQQGGVQLGSSFPAGRDASPVVQPGVGAFDRPAVAAVRVGRFRLAFTAAPDFAGAGGCGLAGAAASADPWLDLAGAYSLALPVGVVAAVGPQLVWPPLVAFEELVEQRQQVPLLVLVAGRQADRQGRAAPVDDQVKAASRTAADGARDLAAPFFASTVEASTSARCQAI
jgi:hypothetical protein